jgi:hypothetical protein
MQAHSRKAAVAIDRRSMQRFVPHQRAGAAEISPVRNQKSGSFGAFEIFFWYCQSM